MDISSDNIINNQYNSNNQNIYMNYMQNRYNEKKRTKIL